MNTYQIDLSDDEIQAVRDCIDWTERNAPNGLPMTPETRAGLLILKRLEGFREKFPGIVANGAEEAKPAPVIEPAPVAETPASA